MSPTKLLTTMITDEFAELYDIRQLGGEPIYVETTDCWETAIKRAAALGCAEIIVTDGYGRNVTTVFSDNPAIKSGLWWELNVDNARRQFYGQSL